jgi:hypothetical protein
MTQADMLNEHLNVIYIIEDLNLSKLKSQAKKIGDAASSGNILRIKKVFDSLPNIPLNDLKLTAKKKFGSEYKQSEKYVDVKLKKAPDKIKDAMSLTRASLLKLKSDSKDPDIQLKVKEILERLDGILKELPGKLAGSGFTLVTLAWIVSFFIGTTLTIAPFLAISGIAFICAAIIVYVTRIFIDIFMRIKKTGKKDIS